MFRNFQGGDLDNEESAEMAHFVPTGHSSAVAFHRHMARRKHRSVAAKIKIVEEIERLGSINQVSLLYDIPRVMIRSFALQHTMKPLISLSPNSATQAMETAASTADGGSPE